MSVAVDLEHRLPGFTLKVAFETPSGVTALIGRSGAGKTTVANIVAGLMKADRARVQVGDMVLCDSARGIWLRPEARRVGYVFQEPRLFPHLTVAENMLFGARRRGRLAEARAEMTGIVEMLGLGGLAGRRPAGLSGGEQQRIAIARALLSGPRLLVLDEPLAALDPARKAEVLPYLERLRDEARIPILYVSHAMEEVARLAHDVVVLETGQVHRVGPVAEIFADPSATPAIPQTETGAVLTAVVEGHEADGLTRLAISGGTVYLPRLEAEVGARVTLRIAASEVILSMQRPEQISALNILPATVEAVLPGRGPGALVQLAVGQDRLVARVTRRSVAALGLAPGVPLYAVVKSLAVAAGNVGTPRG